MNTYTVRTRDGITYHIEASSTEEAFQRASSPAISKHIARMIQEAISHISSIEPHHGPKHLIKNIVFENEFFNR
jgi:hypothetical protein